MSVVDISPALKRFIAQTIDSVEQVEILAILATEPIREWTPQELSDQIRGNLESVLTRVVSLVKREIVCVGASSDLHFIYRPKTQEKREMVENLLRAYSERRFTVIGLIYSGNRDAIQGFTDSFNLRKDV